MIRHGPKINARDFPGADKNGINQDETRRMLINDGLGGLEKIYTSPMFRTQLTAQIAEEIYDLPVELSTELSAYSIGKFEVIKDYPRFSLSHDKLAEQRQIVTGPYTYNPEGREYYFLIPMFSAPWFKNSFPNFEKMKEWDVLRAYGQLSEVQLSPFWTLIDLGRRANRYMKSLPVGDHLVISHSGIMEPTIAAGLDRPLSYINDFIGENQWGFCERAVCDYVRGELRSVEFRGERITHS